MTQWGLDTLFNPAKRHMDEEKRRLQSTREEVGDNSGGKRIDLESGKVTIRRANSAEDGETSDVETAVEDEAGTEAGAEPDSTAAEARARKKAATGKNAEPTDKSVPATEAEQIAEPATDANTKRPEPSAAAIRAARRRGREPR